MPISAQTLEGVKRFDPDALRAFHNHYYEPVYRYVHFKVSDPLSSEDLTSEVFLRVLEAVKQGKAWHAGPDAWIFGIARHVVADHYRKQGRGTEVEFDEGLAEPDERSPVERLVAAEEYRELAQAIALLTDDQRDVVLMRFMEGLSVQDVAEALRKTPGAVKLLQHRALRGLADKMKELPVGKVTGGRSQ
jgi:RNA polymerase sigma-70 factor (ECF subfamily)